MKLRLFLFTILITFIACTSKNEYSPSLATDAFDYSGNLFVFSKNMEKKSDLFSIEKETTLVNTTKFSVCQYFFIEKR